jgi:hypothetical protein
VASGFFPLDEELALLPGRLTPTQAEHLVHLASWMPFERAAQMLGRLVGVQVSEATVRRLTEEAGGRYEAVQTAQSRLSQEGEPPGPVAAKQAISSDGAYVPLVKGQWAEVRTLAIGEVDRDAMANGENEVHVRRLSYFSRMTDAVTFADLAEVEMRRRGVSRASEVCAVTDGADWLQGLIDLHRPDALRILDFPHAAERVAAIAEALQQAGMALPPDALKRSLHILKHRGPRPLLRLLDRLASRSAELEAVREHRTYLSKREALMQYPSYRQQGWPIGSGMVESANKLVMQVRLKGPGMHWAPRHVNPMLALRTAVCNDRWDEAWHESESEGRRQREQRRHLHATPRLTSLVTSFLFLLIRFRLVTTSPLPKTPRPASPPATLPGSSCPSHHHPWRRSIISRPRLYAKK